MRLLRALRLVPLVWGESLGRETEARKMGMSVVCGIRSVPNVYLSFLRM